MTLITIDAQSSVPPFEQVRVQLAERIGSGSLPVGARLPTVRGLAAQLGLAANTVARAFGELEHAGLVTTRGRAGTTVTGSGNAVRERAGAAAADYAVAIRQLGLDDETALEIARAALQAT